MKLEPFARLLVTAGLGTIGGDDADIFVYSMPEKVKQGILLLDDLSGTPIDHELPGFRRPEFQVLVRHPIFAAGLTLANNAVLALTLENETLVGTDGAPDIFVTYVRPKHEPVAFPRSMGDLIEFSVNFESCYAIIS